MSAPTGNKFWMLRGKHGRDRAFSTPDELWETACEYFQWCDDNPWTSKKAIQRTAPSRKKAKKGEDGNKTEQHIQQEITPTQRPYSITGFCVFAGVNMSWWRNFRAKCDREKEDDFSAVLQRIEEIIETQQFEGACVGAFNANIIARKLGLTEKQELDHKNNGRSFGDDIVRVRVEKETLIANGIDEETANSLCDPC